MFFLWKFIRPKSDTLFSQGVGKFLHAHEGLTEQSNNKTFSIMKHLLPTTMAAFSILVHIAQADIVLIQETSVGEVKIRSTMSIKGDLTRTDSGTETSVIINTATGDMTTLMHEQKMVMTMNTKTLQTPPPPTVGGKPIEIAPPKLTSTGKKEKVDGYECEIYTLESMGTVVRMWLTKDYPNQEKLKKQLEPLQKMAAPGAPKAPEMPGMVIKSENEQGGLKYTTRLISVEEKAVKDDAFKVPADYKSPEA
jgi:hypothetical protein